MPFGHSMLSATSTCRSTPFIPAFSILARVPQSDQYMKLQRDKGGILDALLFSIHAKPARHSARAICSVRVRKKRKDEAKKNKYMNEGGEGKEVGDKAQKVSEKKKKHRKKKEKSNTQPKQNKNRQREEDRKQQQQQQKKKSGLNNKKPCYTTENFTPSNFAHHSMFFLPQDIYNMHIKNYRTENVKVTSQDCQ